jgi:hypothetical protein
VFRRRLQAVGEADDGSGQVRCGDRALVDEEAPGLQLADGQAPESGDGYGP